MCTHACGDQRSMSNAFISCSLYVLLRQTLSLKLKLADWTRLLWEAAVALGLQAHTATPHFSHGCLLPKFRPFCLRSEHLPGRALCKMEIRSVPPATLISHGLDKQCQTQSAVSILISWLFVPHLHTILIWSLGVSHYNILSRSENKAPWFGI